MGMEGELKMPTEKTGVLSALFTSVIMGEISPQVSTLRSDDKQMWKKVHVRTISTYWTTTDTFLSFKGKKKITMRVVSQGSQERCGLFLIKVFKAQFDRKWRSNLRHCFPWKFEVPFESGPLCRFYGHLWFLQKNYREK